MLLCSQLLNYYFPLCYGLGLLIWNGGFRYSSTHPTLAMTPIIYKSCFKKKCGLSPIFLSTHTTLATLANQRENIMLNTRISFVFILQLLGLIFLSIWVPLAYTATNCSLVTQIPSTECETLVALYNSTNGPNWKNSSDNNWNVTNYPCSWSGVYCKNGHVWQISLHYNNLQGTIPNLSALVGLADLSIFGNNQLTGPIPTNIGQLQNLEVISLGDNQLTGSIPNLSNLGKLRYLSLSKNKLSGSIPNLSNLINLKTLTLSSNKLSGAIPALNILTKLSNIDLSNNQLSGSIPNLTGLSSLEYLTLRFNQLSGNIPDLRTLISLKHLVLSDNQLNGPVPDLNNLPSLTAAWIHNNPLCRDNNFDYSGWEQEVSSFPYCNPSASCTYDITPTSRDFDVNGGAWTVYITTSDTQCTWTAKSNNTWLVIDAIRDGVGGGEVVYLVAPNNSSDNRTGTLIIAGHTFTVNQNGNICSYAVTPTDENYSSSGGNGSISVTTSNSQCSWIAMSHDYWLNMTPENYITATGNKTISYSIASNESSQNRTGRLTIAGKTFTVTQSGSATTYNLNVYKSGSGNGTVTGSGINCGSDCSQSYNYSTNVTLTASPQAPSTFGSWSGCNSISGTRCTVSMTLAKNVTAIFNAPGQQALTVSKSGSGTGTVSSSPSGINCGSDCNQSYNYNTTVTLTANPQSPSTFGSWSGCNSTSGTRCTVSMTSAKNVTAIFNAPGQQALTVSKSGSGTVSSSPSGINCGSDCNQSYNYNTTVTLTANPQSPSTFGSWSGCNSTSGTRCTVSMTSAKNVTAIFNAAGQQALTVSKSGSGTVSSSPSGINCGSDCNQSYNYNTTVTLTANPQSPSTFGSWSGCNSTSGMQCTVFMTSAKNVTVTFNAPGQQTLTVSKSGSGMGTITGSGISCGNDCNQSYNHGTNVTLTASPQSLSTFGNWSGCDSVNSMQCTVSMISAKNVTAIFNSQQTNCEFVTEISQAECETLLALYNSTDGPNWSDSLSNNWNVTNTPCSWTGISCDGNGKVIQITRNSKNLVGTLPNFDTLSSLQLLDLNTNKLSGGIPSLSTLTVLQYLYLGDNQLSGNIPSLSNLTNLQHLYLSNNQLSGNIPDLNELTALKELFLIGNQLTGNIPDLSNLTALQLIFLNSNQLSGNFPDLSKLIALEHLVLQNNKLSGSIPNLNHLGSLTNLRLSNNQFCRNNNINYHPWQTEVNIFPLCVIDYMLTINLIGNGMVSSGSIGINCGTDCNEDYAKDTVVYLTAMPEVEATFVDWNGCDTTNGNQCVVEMTGEREVTVTFNEIPPPIQQYQLTVDMLGSGVNPVTSEPQGINCGSTCSYLFDQDTSITLIAQENANSTFSWNGCDTTNGNQCVVEMTGEREVTVTFNEIPPPPQYKLMVTKIGYGTLNVEPLGPICGMGSIECLQYQAGTSIKLTAQPSSDYVFSSWSEDCESNNASITVTMDSDKQCTVIFTGRHKLSVQKQGDGTITSEPAGINCGTDCEEEFNASTQVKLTAQANNGFAFTKWADDCSGQNASIMVTMDRAKNCTANFEKIILAYDCNNVTEIPYLECKALESLYDSTNGANWTDSSTNNWKQTNTPCSWEDVICENGHVTSIERRRKNLNGTIPALSALTALETLKLYKNQLFGAIPNFNALTNLGTLILADNQLSGSIPTSLNSLPNLTFLSLGNNQLTGNIPNLSATDLELLYLENNPLSGKLPESLIHLSLRQFFFDETGLCIPNDEVFQNWLNNISEVRGNNIPCYAPDIRIEPSQLIFDNTNTRRRIQHGAASQPKLHKISGGTMLFFDTSNQEVEPSKATISRLQYAELDINALEQPDFEFDLVYTDQIILNLFPDVSFTAFNTLTNYRAKHNYSWFGKIEGMPFGDVILVVNKNEVTGSVNVSGEVYRIRPTENGLHAIQKMNHLPRLSKKDANLRQLRASPKRRSNKPYFQRRSTRRGENVTIDVMVVYTSAAANASGNIESDIQLAVDWANVAYRNSGIQQTLELVHTEQVDYVEFDNLYIDLDHLTDIDGYMDNIHDLRNTHNADLVSLWIEKCTPDACGLAWLLKIVSPTSENIGFSVVAQEEANTPIYVFAHELGHNMGADHDKYALCEGYEREPDECVLEPGEAGAYDDSRGYVHISDSASNSWITIMAYEEECYDYFDVFEGCRVINHFSNPNVTYNSVATGNNLANNALTLNNTAETVAAFRGEELLPIEETKNFSIYNEGDADLVISSISVEGDASWIILGSYSNNLSPNSSMLVEVQVDYKKAPIGRSTNHLRVSSNDPDESESVMEIVVNRQSSGTSGSRVRPNLYDANTQKLQLEVAVPDSSGKVQVFQTDLNLVAKQPENSVSIVFELELDSLKELPNIPPGKMTTYELQTGTLLMPVVNVRDVYGNSQLFEVEMQLLPPTPDFKWLFKITGGLPLEVRAIE